MFPTWPKLYPPKSAKADFGWRSGGGREPHPIPPLFKGRESRAARSESNAMALARHHHRRAGALGFRKLARGGHADAETAVLAANHRTIGVRRIECVEQAAAAGASAATGGQERTLFAARRDRTRGFEFCRGHDVAAEIGRASCRERV